MRCLGAFLYRIINIAAICSEDVLRQDRCTLMVSGNKRLTDMRCHRVCQSDNKRLTDIRHGAREMNLDVSDNRQQGVN